MRLSQALHLRRPPLRGRLPAVRRERARACGNSRRITTPNRCRSTRRSSGSTRPASSGWSTPPRRTGPRRRAGGSCVPLSAELTPDRRNPLMARAQRAVRRPIRARELVAVAVPIFSARSTAARIIASRSSTAPRPSNSARRARRDRARAAERQRRAADAGSAARAARRGGARRADHHGRGVSHCRRAPCRPVGPAGVPLMDAQDRLEQLFDSVSRPIGISAGTIGAARSRRSSWRHLRQAGRQARQPRRVRHRQRKAAPEAEPEAEPAPEAEADYTGGGRRSRA